MLARCISVVNQKGGVAKTTTVVNLGVALAAKGKRVLLLDYDPQANASQFMGLVDEIDAPGVYTTASFTVDLRAPFVPVRDVGGHRGLDLVPANVSLADLEFQLLSEIGGPSRLQKAVARVVEHYDFIITDCPPTLGMLAINAICACPEILIPVKLEPASLLGAVALEGHLKGLAEKINPDVSIVGVLGTFYREVGTMSREVLAQLAALFGPRVFETRIHDSAAIGKAAGQGVPICSSAPATRPAAEYVALTDELLARPARRAAVLPLHSTAETGAA